MNSPSSLVISDRRSSPYLAAMASELRLEQRHAPLLGAEQSAHVGDERLHFLELRLELLDLQAGELGEAHVEDRLGLPLAQLEPLLKLRARRRRVGRGANELDHRVDVVDGDLEPLEDVLALERLVELELRAADDDLVPVRDVVLEHFLERHDLRHELGRVRIGHERQHDDAERRLHHRVLVELVEHDARNRIALELDDDAHAVAIGLVPQVADALELLVAHQLGDVLDQLRLVDLVGELGDDDLRLVRGLLLLDHRARAHHDAAASRLLIILDARAAVDVAAGREVGTLDELPDLGVSMSGLSIRWMSAGDRLAQVVRRDVRRHADRDARRPVDDEVRNGGRQDLRLLEPVVEVRREVDGVLVDVGQHLHRDAGEPRFGVPVGRRRIAIDAAEVSLSVDQRIAQREVLHHAHERVVHALVAVRVILAEHVADDGRGLLVGAARERDRARSSRTARAGAPA